MAEPIMASALATAISTSRRLYGILIQEMIPRCSDLLMLLLLHQLCRDMSEIPMDQLRCGRQRLLNRLLAGHLWFLLITQQMSGTTIGWMRQRDKVLRKAIRFL